MRSEIDALLDKYEEYERIFGIDERESRRARRGNRPKPPPTEVRAELVEESSSIDDFVPSYAAALDPLHFERQWIINSVGPFYRNNLISDVTRRVKGGKEANVYCCQASPATGFELLAAKLYRPRMLRNLKNDAVYKAGRQLRGEEGKQLKGRRYKLALRKKTSFGKRLDIAWWIGNEFMAQRKLYEAGADVPRPVAHQGNSILMAYLGDEHLPAPTLSEVALEKNEAEALFRRIMKNVALMLDLHLVHGDLSAYNILYWEGEISIIDFPQMVDARTNPNSQALFVRDVRRVCEYFDGYGIQTDPYAEAMELWRPYMGPGGIA